MGFLTSSTSSGNLWARATAQFKSWWGDLGIRKKLFLVVGTMALLIAVELFTLLFAMNTLSAVRAFVGGEGLWSKGQKDALHSLWRYSESHRESDFDEYLHHLAVPFSDHRAKLALMQKVPDLEAARAGFLGGRIDGKDIDGVIKLLVRFHENPYLTRAIEQWDRADSLIQQLESEGEKLHLMYTSHERDPAKLKALLGRIDDVNKRLTAAEDEFSHVLGEGSRALEISLMVILVLAVFTVESTGLYLTANLSGKIFRTLKELVEVAQAVGKGQFDRRVAVHSRDELGLLSEALNRMIDDLNRNIGGRQFAEQASEFKSLFVANMSHEIRTPLAAMLGFIGILRDPQLSDHERSKYLDVLERSGQNLNQIVNDILDLSKVESGHLEIEKKSFSLEQVLFDIKSLQQPRATKKRIGLSFVRESSAPDRIVTDPIRLRQILSNIIGNAIKFTDSGHVEMRYRAKPGDAASWLEFDIQDTGMGIAPEDRDRLFHPFSQVDHSLTRRHKGTGLGLVISKNLAQALGGDLELISSQSGAGSTFRVTIQYEPALKIEREDSPAVTVNLRGLNILLVEDSIENQMYLQVALQKQGVLVTLADNGQEAVEKAMNRDFDAVLMDMQMPVMDGFEAVRTLRGLGFQRPVFALTAFAMKEDREKCLEVGCDNYLTKPVALDHLYALLAEIRESF